MPLLRSVLKAPGGKPWDVLSSSSCMFLMHEVVKVLHVMHMWHIIVSYIPSYTLFTLQLLDGMFHANLNYRWQPIEGRSDKKIPQYSKFNWSIRFLCLCQDLEDFVKIIVLWMTVCERKVNHLRMLPLIFGGFSLGFWVWFYFCLFLRLICMYVQFLVWSW